MADSSEEKKLPPSQRKRQDARQQGNVPTSRDLSVSLGTLAAIATLGGVGVMAVRRLSTVVADGIARIGQHPTRDLQAEDLTPLFISGGMIIAITVGPIALAAAGTSAVSTLFQTKMMFSTKRLRLHWERLSPSNGVAKLKPSNAGIETLKTLVIGVVLSILGWRIGKALIVESQRMIWSNPTLALGDGWSTAMRLLWQAGFVFFVVGAIDLFIQKWKHTKSLRMSHQDMREEAKLNEQRPEVKNALRRARMALRRKSMIKAVPTATVIVTNPTHFAIALEYKREKNPAPVVVAKGADLIALKIREIGRHHSVPIIENPPLARALYKECEVGDTIPGPLFGAVAEILAYLIRIKQLVL